MSSITPQGDEALERARLPDPAEAGSVGLNLLAHGPNGFFRAPSNRSLFTIHRCVSLRSADAFVRFRHKLLAIDKKRRRTVMRMAPTETGPIHSHTPTNGSGHLR